MWGQNHLLVNEPTNLYAQYIQDALKILSYAGWPQAAPQEMFSAPVDDRNDLNLLLNIFSNYMGDQFDRPPAQMYVPESFNGRLESVQSVTGSNAQSTEQAGLPNYNFGFVKGALTLSNSPVAYTKQGMLLSYPSGTNAQKKQRYHAGAKTAVSGRTTAKTNIFDMPVIKYSRDGTMQTMSGEASAAQATAEFGLAGTVAVGGVVTALTIVALAMNRNRRT